MDSGLCPRPNAHTSFSVTIISHPTAPPAGPNRSETCPIETVARSLMRLPGVSHHRALRRHRRLQPHSDHSQVWKDDLWQGLLGTMVDIVGKCVSVKPWPGTAWTATVVTHVAPPTPKAPLQHPLERGLVHPKSAALSGGSLTHNPPPRRIQSVLINSSNL